MQRLLAISLPLLLGAAALAQPTQPTTRAADEVASGKLPFIQVDSDKRQIRMECEAVNAEMALEYLVCVAGTSEHETVLRSKARPSHLHLALIMIGARSGEPAHFDKASNNPVGPTGQRLKITCEFVKDGKKISIPAHRLMRNVKSKAEMPQAFWIFAGSCTTERGDYAADLRGRLISVVNFPDSTVDVPEIRSNANETLEWEVNPATAAPKGTTVWVVIEKAP